MDKLQSFFHLETFFNYLNANLNNSPREKAKPSAKEAIPAPVFAVKDKDIPLFDNF